MAQNSEAVVKVCEAASKASDSKLSFCLSKPYMCFVSPEFGGSFGATSCIPSLAEANTEAGVEDGAKDVLLPALCIKICLSIL